MSEINMENFMNRIQDLEQRIAALPQGNLVYKQIKGKKQPYLQWKENGKTVSRYIKIAEREQILAQMEEKKLLQKELADLNRSITVIAERSEIYRTEPAKQRQNHQFRTHVLQGDALMRMTDSVQNYKKRDCYALLRQYIYGDYPGRGMSAVWIASNRENHTFVPDAEGFFTGRICQGCLHQSQDNRYHGGYQSGSAIPF